MLPRFKIGVSNPDFFAVIALIDEAHMACIHRRARLHDGGKVPSENPFLPLADRGGFAAVDGQCGRSYQRCAVEILRRQRACPTSFRSVMYINEKL